jgi:hypothetical protein
MNYTQPLDPVSYLGQMKPKTDINITANTIWLGIPEDGDHHLAKQTPYPSPDFIHHQFTITSLAKIISYPSLTPFTFCPQPPPWPLISFQND